MVHLPHFVPAGEETSVENRREYEDLRGKPVLSVRGTAGADQGLQTLIPLFRRWSGARLLIAGTGRYGDDLRRAAEGCDNIQFLGTNPAIALMRCIGTLLRLSFRRSTTRWLHRSSLWRRFCDARRRSSGTGSMPESIEDSGGGFVYRSDEDLLESMRRLLDDTILRDELGARGYTAYQTQWTTDAYLERTWAS